MAREIPVDLWGPKSGVTTLLAGLHLRIPESTASELIRGQSEELGRNRFILPHGVNNDEWFQIPARSKDDFSFKLTALRSLRTDEKYLKATYSKDRFLLLVVNPYTLSDSEIGKRAIIDLANLQGSVSIDPATGMEIDRRRDRIHAAVKVLTGFAGNLQLRLDNANNTQHLVNQAWEQMVRSGFITQALAGVKKILSQTPNSGIVFTFNDHTGRAAREFDQLTKELKASRSEKWPDVIVVDGVSIATSLIEWAGPRLDAAKPVEDKEYRWTEEFLFKQLNNTERKILITPPWRWSQKVGAILLWPLGLVCLSACSLAFGVSLLLPIARQYAVNLGSFESLLAYWKWFPFTFFVLMLVVSMATTSVIYAKCIRNQVKDECEEHPHDALLSIPFVSAVIDVFVIEESSTRKRTLVRKEQYEALKPPKRAWTPKLFVEYLVAFLILICVGGFAKAASDWLRATFG